MRSTQGGNDTFNDTASLPVSSTTCTSLEGGVVRAGTTCRSSSVRLRDLGSIEPEEKLKLRLKRGHCCCHNDRHNLSYSSVATALIKTPSLGLPYKMASIFLMN